MTKRVTRNDSLFKTGVVSIKSCSHAETYRIAKTFILTLHAKIRTISEISKFSGIFFISLHVLIQKRLHFSKESYLSRLLILERMLRTNSLSFSQ